MKTLIYIEHRDTKTLRIKNKASVPLRLCVFILIVLTCLPTRIQAQDSLQATRHVMRSVMIGAGHNNTFETYLSPLEYEGPEVRFAYETMRMTRLMDGNVSAQNLFQLHASYTENISQTNHTYGGLVNWSYALHYQFRPAKGLKILFGPMLDLNAGVVYNRRNSNNPAQAKAYGGLGASGMLIYRFRIKNYPLTVRWQANLPLLGVMFSPEFGESYYEIFSLGNGGRNVVFTSLHNNPSLRQLLTLDFPVGNTVMRVGYVCDLQQAKVNNLKSHTYSHDFMIGVVRNLYLFHGKKHMTTPPKITPF
ncbi:DUF3316 domain-containing protein [Bacteroides gallinaceum]|uniref:DUF3316 domain-containing protein n=1 Tax=Bacteroides gallinaceum TaxID=1462571 RepID=A0ABT7X261_9BACE|nr:DUF3316 domain-containing protein [Bacteroides gallinaceum]MDN0048178.1 DUF3316 domain-containing protein [Bacteroides gallinaceum]CCZ71430.1 putative uncharacterized protein [Bacteroides sp. CAG:702]